jgi:molecular chaperone GrpE
MANNHDNKHQDQDSHSGLEAHEGDEAHTELPDEAEIEQMDRAPLEVEVGQLKDALLRTRAEMDNLHKRAEREVEKSRRFAVESLLRDLVPVIDSLDQGIEAATQSDSGVGEGMSLTRKLLIDALSRHGLNVVDPVGERFDPQWHEAMSMLPSEEHEPDTVINVLQRGYRLHDRLVRPARVIVARKP